MSEDLGDHPSVQYGDWHGELAADEVDFKDLETLLGLNGHEVCLLVVDVTVYGGYQSIVGFGVDAGSSLQKIVDEANKSGALLVRRLVETDESPADHADTNPPTLPMTITWASDLVASGFKRLHLRFRRKALAGLEVPIYEADPPLG